MVYVCPLMKTVTVSLPKNLRLTILSILPRLILQRNLLAKLMVKYLKLPQSAKKICRELRKSLDLIPTIYMMSCVRKSILIDGIISILKHASGSLMSILILLQVLLSEKSKIEIRQKANRLKSEKAFSMKSKSFGKKSTKDICYITMQSSTIRSIRLF